MTNEVAISDDETSYLEDIDSDISMWMQVMMKLIYNHQWPVPYLNCYFSYT